MFEIVLLKPFSSFPCGLVESVNGWCLVGSADSQGDGDKSPGPRGENKENQRLLENFDVLPFLLKLQNSCGSVANKTRCRILFQLSLSCSLPSATPIDSNAGKPIEVWNGGSILDGSSRPFPLFC